MIIPIKNSLTGIIDKIAEKIILTCENNKCGQIITLLPNGEQDGHKTYFPTHLDCNDKITRYDFELYFKDYKCPKCGEIIKE